MFETLKCLRNQCNPASFLYYLFFVYLFVCFLFCSVPYLCDKTIKNELSKKKRSLTAAARLGFNQTMRAHVIPLLIERHWLPVAAHIKFKSLMLAYRVIAGSAPTYLNALVRANVTPRMLRLSNGARLALPSVQVRQSRLFSFVVPRWWNKLPSTTRAGASCNYSSYISALLFLFILVIFLM